MRCIKCDREATYDSPDKYCDLHWILWVTENWTGKDAVQYCVDILEETWKAYGKPDDWQDMIDEIKAGVA